MGKITLAEAVKLKSILTKRIHELEEEIHRVAFTNVEKGEKVEPGPRTVAQVELELDDVRSDARLLDKLMYRANIDNTITYKNEELSIVEAIELATQLRAKARLYKEFGAANKEEIQYGYAENTTVYRVALFEPEAYRIQALQLEKDAHKLSNLINAKNYSITLDFNDEKYF
ncbi:hypothetical protein [Bacillus niameyensis]|uniref:hypothetical protein n=1 Tax=Bacillus niameyensis TaxID=1522308 RepID=UPI000782D2ED|nr:hypothetical protein [Bacillus niameyensis]